MSAPAKPRRGVFKNDHEARKAWGADVYESIPKSVFAYVAWHLANVASEACDAPGEAARRFLMEWRALEQHGISPPANWVADRLAEGCDHQWVHGAAGGVGCAVCGAKGEA